MTHIPSFARPVLYHCACCGKDKPGAGGRHDGLAFIYAECRRVLEKKQ